MRLIDGRAAIAAALRARSNHDGIKNRDASPACQIKTVLFRASLERENERLKKAVSELTLDKLILKEALKGNVWSAPGLQ